MATGQLIFSLCFDELAFWRGGRQDCGCSAGRGHSRPSLPIAGGAILIGRRAHVRLDYELLRLLTVLIESQETASSASVKQSGRVHIASRLVDTGIPPSSRTTSWAFSVKIKSMNLRAAGVTVASR